MKTSKRSTALSNEELAGKLFGTFDNYDLVDETLEFMEVVEQNHRGNFQMVIVEIVDNDGFRRRFSLGDFGMEC